MTTPLQSLPAKDWALDVDTGNADTASHTATGVATTDNFTLNAHGLVDGQAITTTSGPAATPSIGAATHYVRDVTTNTFKIAKTQGGAAIDVTTDGNLVYVEGPVWTRVRGLSKISSPISSTMVDDSDSDTGGWGSDQVTQRKWSLQCEGKRKRAVAGEDFTPDPGQQAIIDAGSLVGIGSGIHVRWYRRDGAPDAFEGYGNVDYSGGGGGVTELEPFNFTISGSGARIPITNPTA